MNKTFSNDHLLAELRRLVERSSLRQTAKALGFSAPNLHLVLAGKRNITVRLGAALGYDKVPRPKAVRPPQMWTRKQEKE